MARQPRDASLMGQKSILPPIAHSLDGGKKLGLDWDAAEENLTVYHNYTKSQVLLLLRINRNDLVAAEKAGRWSKAKKIRREINKLQETELALSRSTCPTCTNYLHRCQCTVNPIYTPDVNEQRRQKELKGLELLRQSQGWTEEEVAAEQIAKGRRY